VEDYNNWEPLSEIQQLIWFEHSLDQLEEWARRRKRNGFPEPKRTLGRYNFFDVDEVKEWYTLWCKRIKNLGRGTDLNGKR